MTAMKVAQVCCGNWDSMADAPECAQCPRRQHYLGHKIAEQSAALSAVEPAPDGLVERLQKLGEELFALGFDGYLKVVNEARVAIASQSNATALQSTRDAVLEEKNDWMPIETAPKDNKRPLLLAYFYDGELRGLDWDGCWESERESWEMPELYHYWASALATVEEPTHWMYQPEWFAAIRAAKGE